MRNYFRIPNMLLQKALRELDEEIDRLTQIRSIVASLHTDSSLTDLPTALSSDASAQETSETTPYSSAAPSVDRAVGRTASRTAERTVRRSAEPTTEEVQPTSAPSSPLPVPRKLRRLRLERTTRTHRPTPPVARALGGMIPAQPVFIAAKGDAGSVRKNESSVAAGRTPPPAAQEGTLDALLRELSYRPSDGRDLRS